MFFLLRERPLIMINNWRSGPADSLTGVEPCLKTACPRARSAQDKQTEGKQAELWKKPVGHITATVGLQRQASGKYTAVQP